MDRAHIELERRLRPIQAQIMRQHLEPKSSPPKHTRYDSGANDYTLDDNLDVSKYRSPSENEHIYTRPKTDLGSLGRLP